VRLPLRGGGLMEDAEAHAAILDRTRRL
jgi:hypothetical protein